MISLRLNSQFSRFSKEIFSCDAVFTCGEEPEVVLDPVNKRHCQKMWKNKNKTKCKSNDDKNRQKKYGEEKSKMTKIEEFVT